MEQGVGRGYLIAAALALAVAVSNGFARFAYALLLPAMQSDLGLTYAEAGALNTANALGYLAGAVVTLSTIKRTRPALILHIGMWSTALAILLTGATRRFEVLAFLRFVGGLGGALVFVSGSVLSANIFTREPARAATAISIYFSGGGAGILMPGVTLPFVLAAGGDSAWPWGWAGMGVAAILIALVTHWAARQVDAPPPMSASAPWPKRPLLATCIAYGFFAFGYIAYMTFIIAWVRGHGGSASDIALIWAILGLCTMAAPLAWRRPLATWTGGKPLAGPLAAVAAGGLLPLLGASSVIMMVSAALFGLGLFSTPAAVTAIVKRWLAPQSLGRAMAGLTLLFATCQTLGPLVAGALADATGSLAAGLAFSAACLAIGSLIALVQRDPDPSSRDHRP